MNATSQGHHHQRTDRPGAASRIFTALADAHVIVDVIVQNVSAAGTTDISFTTNRDELEKLGTLLHPIVKEIGASDVLKQEGIAKLSVVGIGMRSHIRRGRASLRGSGQGRSQYRDDFHLEIKIARHSRRGEKSWKPPTWLTKPSVWRRPKSIPG